MESNFYVLFGAGMMGRAIAHDLLASDPDCTVSLVDRDNENLRAAFEALPKSRVIPLLLDLDKASDTEVSNAMLGADVVFSASRYDLNPRLARLAIECGAHFGDLGGNTAAVEEQFKLHDAAKAAGVAVLPDCGVAPGSVSILARYCLEKTPDAERLMIRVGGLPQKPKPPLHYALAFSAHGLVANYAEPTEIIREYAIEVVDSLTGLEFQFFNHPLLGRLEAAYTSDGSGTLAKTYAGKLRHMDYKTLRYNGHWEAIRCIKNFGLFSAERTISIGGTTISPRDYLVEHLHATLERGVPDLLALRVAALTGKSDAEGKRLGTTVELVDLKDPVTGHSAMQRTTGYSASICAQMLASGEIKDTGVLKQEEAVPPARFIEEWRKRGINLTESDRL